MQKFTKFSWLVIGVVGFIIVAFGGMGWWKAYSVSKEPVVEPTVLTQSTPEQVVSQPTPTEYTLPPELLGELQGNIPDPRFDFVCIGTRVRGCVNQSDTVAKMIEHVLWSEGGSLSHQFAVDIMQTIHNRMYSAWTCSLRKTTCSNPLWVNLNPDKVQWGNINQKTFERLALYILSQPYTSWNGNEYPAYNGWGMAIDLKDISRSTYLTGLYRDQLTMIENWLLDGIGSDVIDAQIEVIELDSSGKVIHMYQPQMEIRDSGVQYVYTTINYTMDINPEAIVALDFVDAGGNRYYLQFTYLSGYNEDNPDLLTGQNP
jgi:hypothetical protein